MARHGGRARGRPRRWIRRRPPGGSFRGGREFGGGRFGGRPFHRGPRVFVFPYFYDPYYGYDPYAAYCDPYAPSYAPQYCYWDGP